MTPPTRRQPRRTAKKASTRSSANQAENNHPRRPVDIVLHDLAQLARTTSADQQRLVQLSRRRNDPRAAELHAVAAEVHRHYAAQLAQLAVDVHTGRVLRGAPTVTELLDAIDAPATPDVCDVPLSEEDR